MPDSPSTPRADGSFEFEPTDFSDARRALEELPAGLETARMLRPNNWDSRRRTPLPRDHAVTGQTVDWVLNLPTEARPVHLVDSVPRIANSLAERWNDLAEAAEFLNGLLIDRRGGRHGFAPYIKKELVVLHLLAKAEGPRHP